MKRLFFGLLVLSGLAITVSAAPADSMSDMSGDSMPGMTAKPAPTAAPGSGTKGAAHGAAQPAPAAPVQRPSVQPAAAMPAMSADASVPWKTAAFALVAIILVGAVVMRRDHRATTIALVVGAAVFVGELAVLQQRFAASAMDMSTMSDTKGVGPLPVTLATVGAANGR